MTYDFAEIKTVGSEIPPFSEILDQDELCKQLDRLAVSDWGWGAPREIRVQLLKFHRGRRYVFEICVETESGWHSLIGKIFVRDRSDIFEVREALWAAGFGLRAEFSIPQALNFLPQSCLLLEEKINGPSAREIFLNGNRRESTEAAVRCALWLARFHAVAPRLGKVAILGEELTLMRHWTHILTDNGEPFASKSNLILQKLLAAASAPSTAECCTSHGSYLPEHVLLDGQRTVAIDWDEYGVADPSVDVAWFIVGVQRLAQKHLSSLHQLDEIIEVFLRTYISSGRRETLGRLPFYRAAECLHRAKRDSVSQTEGWRERAEAMLDEGLRNLSAYR